MPSSGSFTCPFQYNPVDREWQQETCEAMGLNYITSNGITPEGREVGLEPPTTFTRIVGDGNCLFRALAHIITVSEEKHMDVRRGIVSHMQTIGNLLVGGHVREGDIDTYINSSRIEHDREWGTDVEILTLAHMLKTPVYTYHEDTKSLEGHVLLPGLTLVKHSFTYVLLRFYTLGNSSTSCSKLSRWTTFITMFYSWFTQELEQLTARISAPVAINSTLQVLNHSSST